MPAGVTTLLAMRTAVRQRADMVGTLFVTDAELTSYINASAYELYDLLVQCYGADYYLANAYAITTDGTNNAYALPSDFYKLRGVDLQSATGAAGWVNLQPFNFADRNRYNAAGAGFWGIRYRLAGSNLLLTPLPPSGISLRVWYVPRWTALSADGDTFDAVSGWEEYVVTDAAIKVLQKEEADVSALMAQKAALIQRIESAAQNRDAANPQTTTDSLGESGLYLPGWW